MISACVIAKNEAAVIGRCINSVKRIADEIILVDTGSTDDTVRIAEGLGARVFFREWDNDFSAAKNHALNQVRGDWVIFLDADEYFVEDSELKLPFYIKNAKTKAFMCMMRHIDAEGSVMAQNYSLRVFKNSPDIRYKGIVHERLFDGDSEIKFNLLKDVIIHHTGYTKANLAEKDARNYELIMKMEKAGHRDQFTSYYLAMHFFQKGDYQKAYHYTNEFKKFARLNLKKDEHIFLFRIFIVRLASMIELDNIDTEDTYKEIQNFLWLYPTHPEIKLCEARFYDKLGMYDKAVESYNEAILLNEKYDGENQNLFWEQYQTVFIRIGEIYELKGKGSQSFDCYVKVLKSDKTNLTALARLAELLRYESTAEVTALLDSLYDTASAEDLKRIVTVLFGVRHKELYLHYFSLYYKLEKNVNHAFLILYFILSGETKSAADAALFTLERSKSDIITRLLVLSLIIGNHKDIYLANKERIGGAHALILKAWFGDEQPPVTGEQFKTAAELIDDLIKTGDIAVLKNLLAKIEYLDEQYCEELGDCFSKNMICDVANDYYGLSEKSKDVGDLFFKIGVNCYRLNRYAKSVEYLERALKKSDKKERAINYLNWIIESDAPPDVKQGARLVIAEHESLY